MDTPEAPERVMIREFVLSYTLRDRTSRLLGGQGMPQVGVNLGSAIAVLIRRQGWTP